MRNLRFIRYTTLLIVAAVALVLWRRSQPASVRIEIAESGYAYCVQELLGPQPTPAVDMAELVRRSFPELKPVGGLLPGMVWTFHDGPDFYVWRASDPEQKSNVGIYFGTCPDFRAETARVEIGQVGKRKVVWCKTRDPRSGVRYDCLFTHVQDDAAIPLQLHVWATAETEDEAKQMTTALAGITFQRVAAP